MLTAMSRAHSLEEALIDRVDSAAALASAPTWSTPGSPCRKRRRSVSERVTSTERAGHQGGSAGWSWLRDPSAQPLKSLQASEPSRPSPGPGTRRDPTGAAAGLVGGGGRLRRSAETKLGMTSLP